ncbi:MAG: hypothetical protein ACREJ6_03340, partial [Candidatus Methylomirabilis sp.]
MPITNLVATATGFDNATWTLGMGATKVTAINNDDGIGGDYITDGGVATHQSFIFSDLPTDARAAAILQYEVESTARRAGGIAGTPRSPRIGTSAAGQSGTT